MPKTGMNMPNTGMDMPNAPKMMPNTGMNMPNTGMNMPNMGMDMPNTGMNMPNTGMNMPNMGMDMKNMDMAKMMQNMMNMQMQGKGKCNISVYVASYNAWIIDVYIYIGQLDLIVVHSRLYRNVYGCNASNLSGTYDGRERICSVPESSECN